MKTETKFTPGPWEWRKSAWFGYSALINPSLNCDVLLAGGENDGDSPITWLGEEMSQCDAHLIAAAPDLYEALEKALAELKAYELAASGEDYNNPKINSALAKARGE